MTGRIKKLVPDRGFGFIQVEGSRKDIFLHVSGMKRKGDFDSLQADDQVEFDVEESDRGPKAVSCRIVD